MTYADSCHYAALGIGSFQLLANSALLLRGIARLPAEVRNEAASARIADLLHTAWVYGMLGNVCVSVVLLLIASPLRAGDPLARRLAVAVATYYVTVGAAAYWAAPGRHLGLLVFSGFGLVLLALLWLSR